MLFTLWGDLDIPGVTTTVTVKSPLRLVESHTWAVNENWPFQLAAGMKVKRPAAEMVRVPACWLPTTTGAGVVSPGV
jgi:hypothetical protein